MENITKEQAVGFLKFKATKCDQMFMCSTCMFAEKLKYMDSVIECRNKAKQIAKLVILTSEK